MCNGVVIDAHMMPAIRDELVRGSGQLCNLINWFLQNCGIARTSQIEIHWRTKISDKDPFFWHWYAQQILNRSIHDIKPKNLGRDVKKRLRIKYGLPKDPYLTAYLECAYATNEPRYILAEDMDFHDPKARNQATKTQIMIRESRTGALCQYLETQLKIRVGTTQDCRLHFSSFQGSCPSRGNTNRVQCSKVP
jgi:hypothetical protein